MGAAGDRGVIPEADLALLTGLLTTAMSAAAQPGEAGWSVALAARAERLMNEGLLSAPGAVTDDLPRLRRMLTAQWRTLPALWSRPQP